MISVAEGQAKQIRSPEISGEVQLIEHNHLKS